MFKDEELRKFVLYGAITGLLIMLMACVAQLCFVPGSECKIPFFTVDETEVAFDAPPKYVLKEGATYQAKISTNYGDFYVSLYEKNAPNTVNNFVFLASKGYYNGVKFHRLFPDLLIQTGDRNTLDKDSSNDGLGGPGYVINDEINWETAGVPDKQQEVLKAEGYSSDPNVISKSFRSYSLAMANSGKPNTNGSQFFITVKGEEDTKIASLRGRHTVFGRLTQGFDVVDKMNQVKVNGADTNAPVPQKDIYIKTIEILETTPDVKAPNDKSKDQTVVFK